MPYFVVFTRESNGKRRKYGRKVYQNTASEARNAVNRLWHNHAPKIISCRKATDKDPMIRDY